MKKLHEMLLLFIFLASSPLSIYSMWIPRLRQITGTRKTISTTPIAQAIEKKESWSDWFRRMWYTPRSNEKRLNKLDKVVQELELYVKKLTLYLVNLVHRQILLLMNYAENITSNYTKNITIKNNKLSI